MLIYTLVRFCTIMFIFSMSFCVHASGLRLAMEMAAAERTESERVERARRATVAAVVQNPLAAPDDSEERFSDLPRVDSMEMLPHGSRMLHEVNILAFEGPDRLEVMSVESSDFDLTQVRPSSIQGRRELTPLRRTVACQTDQPPALEQLDDNCCSCSCCCCTLVARWFSGKQG